MSTILKNTKVEQVQRPAVNQKEISGPARQQNDDVKAKNSEKKKRDPLVVPEIPGTMKKLLNDKDRPVKELKAINVKFFPNNIQEIEYLVLHTHDDGTQEDLVLTASQFMKLQEQVVQKRKAEHEKQSFEGLGNKYYRRLLVILPEEITVAEGRRIQAVKPPSVAKKLMGMTQKEFADSFPTPESLVSFWEKAPDTSLKAMDDYQRSLRPNVNWSDTLVAARREITEQKEARALRELEKSKRKAALVEAEMDPKGASKEIDAKGSQSRNTRLFDTGPKNGLGSTTKVSWADEEDSDAEKRFHTALAHFNGLADNLKGKVPRDQLFNLDGYNNPDYLTWFIANIELIKNGNKPLDIVSSPLTAEQKKVLEQI